MEKVKKIKTYKCAYQHCCCNNGMVAENESLKVGNRRWHKQCYETRELIEEIIEIYQEKISQTVVASYLRRVVNDIVFGKKLRNPKLEEWESNLEAARYLNFCMKYSVENNRRVTNPAGLHYLIDNKRIKDEYKKAKDLEVQKEIRKKEKENIEKPSVPQSKPVAKNMPTNNLGFGNILGGH